MCHVRSETVIMRDGTQLADRYHAMLDKDSWIVGLDLGERSSGALCFSCWLADGSDRITGVHVIETWSRPYIAGDCIAAVHRAVAHASRDLGISPPPHITVVETDDTVGALTHAAEGAAGLVIGRAARSYDGALVRLGHVARRLLRSLPGPVVVVPPDLTAVAPGPVLLATDLGVATSAALSFARALAAHHGRALEVVYVGEARHNDLIDELDPGWLAAREVHNAEVTRSLDVWMHEHGLDGSSRHVVFGDPSEQISRTAVQCGAALVVVGSRRLGAGTRLFLSSTASALAGVAKCPVAVVPPLVDARA